MGYPEDQGESIAVFCPREAVKAGIAPNSKSTFTTFIRTLS